MNRQVIFRSNLFDPTQKVITEVDGALSYRDIFRSLTYYPISYARIIDGDVKVNPNDYDSTPKSEQVLIKLYPGYGWSDFKDDVGGAVGYIGNEIDDATNVNWSNPWDIAQSALAIVNPIGYINLRLTKTAAEWYIKQLMPDLPGSTASVNPKENPGLKGGSNPARYMQRLPILLGKHLIHPDMAGQYFISLPTFTSTVYGYTFTFRSNDQALHALFCAGYNNIQVDTSTYKIGETALTTENFPYSIIELSQNGSAFTYYPKRVISSSVSTELTCPVVNNQPVTTYITKTTPTNTRKIEIFISFPRGLYTSNSGAIGNATVALYIEYKPVGESTWRYLAAPVYTAATNETKRIRESKVLDNITSSGADYCATRQYNIRVTKTTPDTDASNIVDSVYFDVLQSVTGVFDGTNVDTSPIPAYAEDGVTPIRSKLTLFALRIKADQNTNGELASFNFIGQSKVPVYSGSGSGASSWTTVSASSNPAALFLYVIRDANINKNYASVTADQINWSSFETWYTYCNTNGYECNTYITNEIVIEELLNQICTCGRATWSIVDGKFNIIVDKAQTTICQYFTPRNSWGLAASKSFDDLPTGLRISYIDAAAGYVNTEIYVYADPDSSGKDDKIDDVSLFGCVTSAEAYKRGRYILANLYLRRETFTFSADIEHISCTRWDRIALSHDVCSVGLGYARIKTLRISGSNVTGFELDDRVTFEPSVSNYSITIRCQDGTGVTYAIQNLASSENVDTDEITFVTPVVSASAPFHLDDLLIFGISGSEVLDLIITDIEPVDDYSAKLSCIPYVAELYTWESGDIPNYDPKISTPGDLNNAVYTGIPIDAAELAVSVDSKVGATNNYDTALTIASATTILMSTDSYIPMFPFYDAARDMLIYLNNLTGTIYEKSINSTDEGTELVNDAGYVFCIGYYVRCSDGYICDYTGTAIVSVESWCPQIDSSGNIYYIKLSDGCIYKFSPGENTTVQVSTYALKHLWMNITSDGLMLIQDDGTLSTSGKNELVLINLSDGSYAGTIISDIEEAREFQVYDTDVYMSLDADFNLNKITESGQLLFIPNVAQYDAFSGNIFYLKTTDDRLYKQYKNLDSAKISTRPYVRTSTQVVNITGNIENGSNIVTGISAIEMAFVDIGDFLSGTGIPSGAYIETVDEDNGRVILNCNATATTSGLTITVASSRLLLDAATSILSGSISNTHLAADSVLAVNIKDAEITEAKIYNAAVTETKISSGAVTETKISSGAVTEGKIYTAAVTTDKIAGGAVVESKIGSGAVTESKIGTGAVTADKIGSGAVTHAKIGDNAIEQHNMADGSVGTAELIDLSVTTGKIATVTHGYSGANDSTTTLTNQYYQLPLYALNYDTLSEFSTSDYGFKLKNDGYYLINIDLGFYVSCSTAAELRIYVYKNGSWLWTPEVIKTTTDTSSFYYVSRAKVFKLSVNDIITLHVYGYGTSVSFRHLSTYLGINRLI